MRVGMVNVLSYSIAAYFKNLKFLLLFSLPFVIAFLIPAFASLPTYNDAGAIFIRTASVFANLNALNASVIAVSVFFSLLFLSFSIVAINIVVKHSRVSIRIKDEVIRGMEKYTSKVFVLLLAFTAIVMLVNIVSYVYGLTAIPTYVAALVLTPFLFYAPSSIVIDDRSVARSIRASLKFFTKRFDYFLLWLAIAIALITVFDFAFIAVSGTLISRYAMLIFNSVIILPFLVLLQSELYLKRFPLLKR
jgi:hypothetical protein